jgi:hypothetical protein
MRVHLTPRLFPWEEIDDSPDLRTIGQCLQAIPDRKLLNSLREARGKGSNDYPVEVLWGTLLLKIILRHVSMQDCLAELRRNPALWKFLGIGRQEQIPNPWNMSRFLKNLGSEPHLTLLREMFADLARALALTVPDLGVTTAGDATCLHARSSRGDDSTSLPAPSHGRKEYRDEQGKVTSVYEWQGYKLHLLVDTNHEVALSFSVSTATTADAHVLPELVESAREILPEDRIETLAYDRAADTNQTHRFLHDLGIKPVVQTRRLWKDELERRLPGHGPDSNVVHDELGTVYCYDMTTDPPTKQRMACIGHEPSRGTIKYRCPARHGGYSCPYEAHCNKGKKYGKTVRVKQEIDLRRFPSIPRESRKFQRLYAGRTAAWRVNARLKLFWGVDDGNITGPERFHAMVGTVMVVHAAFATLLASASRRKGSLSPTRPAPITKALAERPPG